MREKIVLICPTPQALLDAADWHDGQFPHGRMRELPAAEGVTRHLIDS
jgi:hypothetical protein